MMKRNRKALALLTSVLLAAATAGCGNPVENNGSAPGVIVSLSESGTKTGAGSDTGEPAVTAESTEEPVATAEPTTAPTAEPVATAEPTAVPTDTPAPSPEEQAWIDAVYESYINFLNVRTEANAKLMEGDIEGYTIMRQTAYDNFADLLGISDGRDELSAKLSPYAYTVGFEQKGGSGTYLLQTSDEKHLALMFVDENGDPGVSGDSMWVVTSENPKTYYGLEVMRDTRNDKLEELESSGIEEDVTKVMNQACWITFE